MSGNVFLICLSILGTINLIMFSLFCYFLKGTYETVLTIKASISTSKDKIIEIEKKLSKHEIVITEIVQNLKFLHKEK